MKYLLDTCVVSELIRKRPCEKVTTWVARHDETGLFLSVVTIGELQKGISKLPAARKRQQLQTWFDHHLYRRFSGRITVNPNQCGGRPCIRGMRIRVKDILDMLAAGVAEEEILKDYPYLEPQDIQAALEFAAMQSDHPVFQTA